MELDAFLRSGALSPRKPHVYVYSQFWFHYSHCFSTVATSSWLRLLYHKAGPDKFKKCMDWRDSKRPSSSFGMPCSALLTTTPLESSMLNKQESICAMMVLDALPPPATTFYPFSTHLRHYKILEQVKFSVSPISTRLLHQVLNLIFLEDFLSFDLSAIINIFVINIVLLPKSFSRFLWTMQTRIMGGHVSTCILISKSR